jgi:hypothetical protein
MQEFSPPITPEPSKLARTALIAAVVTLFILPIGGNIVAIALSVLARRQIRVSNGQLSGQRMAIGALIISCVGLCIHFSMFMAAAILSGM